MTKDLSIIVCTYNRALFLKECLCSLTQQTLSPERFEVLVIDNDSKDETQSVAEQFCQKYGHFKVFLETERGHSQARNRGWKEACGRYVAYIDDDCHAASLWAEKILASFAGINPSPTAVGGKILPRYATPPPAWFADSLETRSWGNSKTFLGPPVDRLGFSGANMAFPRNLLEEMGGFSCRFGMVDGKLRMGEDTEFFMRLVVAGHGRFWYDPEIVVKHWTPPELFSLWARLSRSYRCGRSHYYLEPSGIPRSDLRLILSGFYQLVKGGACLFKPPGEKLAYLVKAAERAAHQLGVYVETWAAE